MLIWDALSHLRRDETIQHAIAGSGSGMIAAVLVTPLDVVKVRLQNQVIKPATIPKYKGTYRTLAIIWQEEGLRGLFSGLTPSMIAYLPDRAIWFSIYHHCKVEFPKRLGSRYHETPTVHFLSTLVASVACTVATTPLWLIRTRLMTQGVKGTHPYYYTSVASAFTTIARQEGVLTLYRGLGPSLLGVSHSLVMFPLYEKLKKVIADYESHKRGTISTISNLGILVASSISKCIASLATYPHEVLRTRLQTQMTATYVQDSLALESQSSQIFRKPLSSSSTSSSSTTTVTTNSPTNNITAKPSAQTSKTSFANISSNQKPKYRGVLQSAKVIIAEEGVLSMYKGLSTSLIRQVPAAAISLFVYELLVRELAL